MHAKNIGENLVELLPIKINNILQIIQSKERRIKGSV